MITERPSRLAGRGLLNGAAVGALAALVIGLALASGSGPANAATGSPIATLFVAPGETKTTSVALEQGARYELVVSEGWSEALSSGGSTYTYFYDAIYCYGHSGPEPVPSGAHCAETPPGPYCCNDVTVSYGGNDYRIYTLASSSGTPFPYRSDHVYSAAFTAAASGRLTVKVNPFYSSGSSIAGRLKFELFEVGGGCPAARVGATPRQACSGPQKVEFNWVLDGFPDHPGARLLPDDLVGVESETVNTRLRRANEDSPWRAKGTVKMTTTYLSQGSGFQEKSITFVFAGSSGYSRAPGHRVIQHAPAEVVRSNDRECRVGTRVSFTYIFKLDEQNKPSRILYMNPRPQTSGTPPCLVDLRYAGDIRWGPDKVRRGRISKPINVGT